MEKVQRPMPNNRAVPNVYRWVSGGVRPMKTSVSPLQRRQRKGGIVINGGVYYGPFVFPKIWIRNAPTIGGDDDDK